MRRLLHRFELRIAVLTALALLFAQVGAVSHAYSHDPSGKQSTHQIGASHESCNDCLAYAPLLAGAGTPLALPPVEPQGRAVATRATTDSLVDLSLNLAFRSRAPPLAF